MGPTREFPDLDFLRPAYQFQVLHQTPPPTEPWPEFLARTDLHLAVVVFRRLRRVLEIIFSDGLPLIDDATDNLYRQLHRQFLEALEAAEPLKELRGSFPPGVPASLFLISGDRQAAWDASIRPASDRYWARLLSECDKRGVTEFDGLASLVTGLAEYDQMIVVLAEAKKRLVQQRRTTDGRPHDQGDPVLPPSDPMADCTSKALDAEATPGDRETSNPEPFKPLDVIKNQKHREMVRLFRVEGVGRKGR